MSEGFLFVSNDKLETLVRGRLPFRVIEWVDSFYHFRMEYEMLVNCSEQKSPILGFPFVSLRASLAHAKWNIHHSFVGGPSAA